MTTTLSERAMLTSLLIYRYRAQGHSKEIDSRVTQALQTKRKAGSTRIDLLDPKSLRATQTAAYNLSKNYLRYTLPWDEKTRILPSALYQPFMEKHNDLTRVYDMASDEFVGIYPDLLWQAQNDLGDEICNLMKFPSVLEIRSKFDVRLSFQPVPTVGDFRVQMSNDELDMIKSEMQEREKAQLARSMNFAWKRLHDAIADMVDRLSKPRFHNTVVENIRAITDVLPELNLAGDPELDRMRDIVIEKLCRYSPQHLRDNEAARSEIAQEATRIAGNIRILRLDLNSVSEDLDEDINQSTRRSLNVVNIIPELPESRLRMSMGANA